MRTTQADIGARNRSHTNEVKGTGEECSEGRGKRNLMPHAHRYRCSYQLLFGNVHLKVAVGMSFGKLFGKGRVAYLTIQSDHIRVSFAMPAIDILQERDALALDRPGNNRGRRAIWLHSPSICLVYLFIVVPIDNDSVPAKGLGTQRIGSCIPPQLGFPALP